MYYEDSYTVPHKNLHYKVDSVSSNNLKSKQSISVWKILSAMVATGVMAVIFSALGKLYSRGFSNHGKPTEPCASSVGDSDTSEHQTSIRSCPLFSSNIDISPMELETLCISVMERVKHDLGLAGSIEFSADVGAWTGEIPNYLRTLNGMEIFQKSDAPPGGSGENHGDATADPSHSIISEKRQSPDVVGEVTQAPFAQDVASYEVPNYCTLSSADEKVLSMLAEAICTCALENTKNNFFGNKWGMPSRRTLGWLKKCRKITSMDSSVCLYQFSYNEVTGNAKKLAEVLESNKRNSVLEAGKSRHAWWPLPAYPTVGIDDISEFGKLVEEHVPAYKLQVDADKFKNVKFEAWQKSQDNR